MAAILRVRKPDGTYADVPSLVGPPGADGYSPTVSLKQKDDGVEITVQNKDGTQTANVLHGQKGNDGSPGATGATPRFTVTAVTGEAGTAASVTQSGTAENPTLEFTIPRGTTGDPGEDAPQESVLYTAQTLEDAQKTQARENIGAADAATVSSLKTEKANKSIVSDAWQTGRTYEKGAYCIYNNNLYKALVRTTTEPTTESDWAKCTVTKEIMSITPKNTEHKQLSTNYGIIDFYECDGVVSFYGNLSNMPVGNKLSVGRVPSSPPIYDYAVSPFYDSDTPFASIGSVWIYRGGSFDLFKPDEKTSGYVCGTYIGNR